jgi:hypothetical protein
MITKTRTSTRRPSTSARTPAADPKAPTRRRECVPCEIPPFCRTNYFTGRLLTEHDFTAEQRYFRDKFRLHYRALHGWGVVCGLRVKPHPYCPHLRLIVEPGVAIDACGYEVVIAEEVELDLPKRPSTPSSGTSASPPADNAGQTGYAAPERPDYGDETWIPLYVCLQYAECETDFVPAPFDECGCNDEHGRQAARVCESYTLTLRQGTPPRVDRDAELDCEKIDRDGWRECSAPERADCIPLAVLDRYIPGETVTEDMLDNWSYRRLLPSVEQQQRLLRCLLKRIPTHSLTRISSMGWTHAQEYTCGDFIRSFTGHYEHEGAFEVRFDHPVSRECLTPRVFQALVAPFRRGAIALEVAPSRVWSNPEGTSYYLQINRDYVQRDLDRIGFDVYVTLRCNLVLDQHGRAVDGDLLARASAGQLVVAPPTGDGIAGGSFESWIRVRP